MNPPAIAPASSADTPASRLATRLAFFVAGCGIAAWAPMVPFAKQRLGVDDRQLGLLLLCIGIGSIIAMPITGALSARSGSRPIIILSALVIAAALPLLAVLSTPPAIGACLFLFGAALGSLDVAMNVHAMEVERAAQKPLMSGFHALFSIGGFAGSGLVTLLLWLNLSPRAAAAITTGLILLAIMLAIPGLIGAAPGARGPLFALPRSAILLLAFLAAVTFLIEGALLDWSALLITDLKLLAKEQSGLGYTIFSIAMTLARLTGDRITQRLGDLATMFIGSLIAITGFILILLVPTTPIALLGFLLVGLGAANIVPILFRRAGSQPDIPPGLAIAAVTTTGYGGILLGPAAIGELAHAWGLPTAFWLLVALFTLVPLTAHRAAAPPTSRQA